MMSQNFLHIYVYVISLLFYFFNCIYVYILRFKLFIIFYTTQYNFMKISTCDLFMYNSHLYQKTPISYTLSLLAKANSFKDHMQHKNKSTFSETSLGLLLLLLN